MRDDHDLSKATDISDNGIDCPPTDVDGSYTDGFIALFTGDTPEIQTDDFEPTDTYIAPEIPEQGELTATGFFHVQAHDGRCWSVTPDEKPFYSIGINACNPNGSVDAGTGENRYRTAVEQNYDGATWSEKVDSWATATVGRLQTWGFNTIGAWSNWEVLGESMPYTIILNISGVDWMVGEVPDYFSDEFANCCAQVATNDVAPRKDNPNLIGWFLDNELRWGWDWRSPKTLLADYLAMPDTTPGRRIPDAYRGDPSGFLKAAASRYFPITTTAIRSADPNHLILGIRSISVMTHPLVPEAAGPCVDVYSVNNYEFLPELYAAVSAAGQEFVVYRNWLVAYHQLTGRPIMIAEYSMRSSEADVPSTTPIFYPTYSTQAGRAVAWESYARNCFTRPYIVGMHWF